MTAGTTQSPEVREALLVNARVASRLLGIGTRLLWTLTNRRELPCVRVGRLVRYRPEDLRAFAAERRS